MLDQYFCSFSFLSLLFFFFCFFFFSSRRRHTRSTRDWSSDVCSSDLLSLRPQRLSEFIGQDRVKESLRIYIDAALARREPRSEERRVGKECRSRWSPYQ